MHGIGGAKVPGIDASGPTTDLAVVTNDDRAPAGRPVPHRGDLALAAGLMVVAALAGGYVDGARPDTVAPASWSQWLLLLTPSALVAARRTWPLGVTVAATAAQAAIWVSGLPDVLLPLIVLLYSAASDGGRRGVPVAIGAGAVLTAVTGLGVVVAGDVTVYQLPLIALTCGTAILLGAQADRQRRTAAELAATVTTTRLRGQHERSEAVATERSRIARELHDIIGHTLATIAVRAEAADRVASRRPDAARDAVGAIATAARSALDETRRVLAGLRTSTGADLGPPPDLDSIRRLVDDVADAGVTVALATTGCDDHVPPAVVVGGAHRIVQESLTNAVKHAGPGVHVRVALTCGPDWLEIVVIDDGANEAGGRSGGEPVDGATSEVPGFGLAGMAERAEVLGGTFAAGPEPGGGFAVRARLPTGRAS